MRRAASRAFHPAQASTAARASATSVLHTDCFGVGIDVCRYIICICMDRRKAMLTTASRAYGVADPAEVRHMSGREHLQAMLDGRLPTPPIMKTLSFSLTEIGDGFAVFEGDTGPHLLNPLGIVHGGWAMTLIDSAAGCAAHTLRPGRRAAMRRLRPRPISPGPSPRTRAASAPKGARSAAGGASSPARRGSSTPRAAFWRMGPRRSWSFAGGDETPAKPAPEAA